MDAAAPATQPHDSDPAYRREVDRETVRLLRRLRDDNARIIDLLRLICLSLGRIEQHVAGPADGLDGWPATG